MKWLSLPSEDDGNVKEQKVESNQEVWDACQRYMTPEVYDQANEDEDEEVTKEEVAELVLESALSELPADKVNTLRLMAANMFESFKDKSDLVNLRWWADKANHALIGR